MNCLTIDFDIIMRPSIQLYNDLVGSEWSIPSIEKEYPLLSNVLPPDYEIYKYLTQLLISKFKKLDSNRVFFIKSHETAAKLLEGVKEVNLCNIDHHHDVGYNGTTAASRIIRPQSGNWVKYLKDKGNVIAYTWIHNSNSDQSFDDEKLGKYIDVEYELQQVDLYSMTDEIDRLIICNSPEWIPSQYQGLWEIWMTIAEEWYGTRITAI